MSATRSTARAKRARALALLAAAALLVGQAGLWLAIEPLATWSYDLSWWSAIFLADAIVCLRTGSSIALGRPRAFAALAFASGAFWLLFECANFRLRNWYYVGIPRDLLTRTIGVYVSFATVLPGVLEVHALLESFASGPRPAPVVPGAGTRALLAACGAACLVLPLAFPRWAYPLIWGAPFLLLEPWLAPRDERSLLARWCGGDRGPLLRLLVAGAVCGALWETWNWRSPAKWIYTVPLFEEGKLFEMPYLGFLGFVPFALGCHSAARALASLGWIPEWEGPGGAARARRPRAAAAFLALAFSAAAIVGISRWTIRATRPWIADVPGIPAAAAARLEAAGIHRPEELVAAAERRDALLESIAPDAAERARWLAAARLMGVRGLGLRGAGWLAAAGVHTVEELAASDPAELERRMLADPSGLPPEPYPAEIRVWVRGARAARR